MTTKRYPINQSPFYKLNNHARLATILGIDAKTLRKIVSAGAKNYKFGRTGENRERTLEVPKARLFRIHRRINHLLSRINAPDYLCSGVKTRSHIYNAQQHIGNRAVTKLDIKKYYQSTTTKCVKTGIKKKFKMSEDIAETFSLLCTVNGFVPTGSPVSQSICYFANSGIFDHINSYAKARQISFTLYVDDLTFSGTQIPKNLITYVRNYLSEHRQYKTHKIRNYKAESEKVITGVVVSNAGMRVKNSQRQNIWKFMKCEADYARQEPTAPHTIEFFQKYIGTLFAAGQINPRYRQIGKRVVQCRKQLGINAKNQHTPRL